MKQKTFKNKIKVRKQYPAEVAKCLEDIPQHEKKLNKHLRILQKKLLALQNQHQKVTIWVAQQLNICLTEKKIRMKNK